MTSYDYQEALKNAAKTMVRVKNARRLLKMIVRFIVREVGLTHASILIYDQTRARYVFIDSKGTHKIPIQLIKLDATNPLIRWFSKDGPRIKVNKDYVTVEQVKGFLEHPENLDQDHVEGLKLHLRQINDVMITLKAAVCVPGYYKQELLGVLILGDKLNKENFSAEELAFFQTLANDASMTLKNTNFQEDLLSKNILLEKQKKILEERLIEIEQMRKKEQETYYQIVMSLAHEVYEKDPYTSGHMEEVGRLGVMTAEELGYDLTGRKKDVLVASLHLHDVGKIGIPDHILKKASSLSDQEWEVIKEHPVRGAKILEPLTDFKEVANIVKHHHERYDGKGYPDGLKGNEIPIEARIIAVVDAFHAIISTRSYRKGRSIEYAFQELEKHSGTQFDPHVVQAFKRVFHRAYLRPQKQYKAAAS